MYTLGEIASVTGAKCEGDNSVSVNYFLHDSRNLMFPAESLFIAIKTTRNNGHNYVTQLYKNGVRAFLVVKNEIDLSVFPEASFLISDEPLNVIQKLAVHHRKKFNIPVIGITGSNGKTIVKEWLYQALKERYSICRSPKSYNSQIGVPLSVLNLSAEHDLAIFEAGISKPCEMEKLAEIIQPTVGVFTYLGSAHDEGFGDKREKAAEKFKLFERTEKIIANGIDKNDIPAQYKNKIINTADFTELKIKTAFTDSASVTNLQTCAAVLNVIAPGDKTLLSQLEKLQPVALRLEIKNGIHNSLIINDYYNSDLDSLKIAINFLRQQNRKPRKVVIVSDIEQSGTSPAILYKKVNELLSQQNISLVIGIGEVISNHKELFPAGSLFFKDTSHFVDQIKGLATELNNATILLKGGRSFGFENISRVLQLKSHDTVFEIDLNKLTENVNYYRSLLNSDVQLMCMVKAMGYGSGSTEIARTLENIGVNYLAVAYADEGVELREGLINLPVMVMSPEEDAFDDIINYQLEPEIYSFKILEQFIKKLDAVGFTEPFPIHIKIDTGMKRLGFEENDVPALIQKLSVISNVKVKSVFSHLAGTDNPDLDDFTNQQIGIFERCYASIETALGYKVLKHICNSGGITRFKSAHYDMVRLGIGMYGIGVTENEQKKLQNVGALKTRISQIKKVKAGETVGYNRNGKPEKDLTIATVPIGYADGFSRLLGNGNHGVFIKGRICKTVGNICMDMCMIDVSEINCAEGDEVIIFEDTQQIQQLAKALNSISYEVLTNVSARVKRVYTQE